LKDVNATAEVLEDDHGYDPDDDESDPSKFIKALVDEQGKTLAQLVEKVSSSVEDTEVQSGEHDGDDTIATRLLSNADYEQANTLQDFFNSCRELYMDPRFALRLMNQRDGSFALYWLQVMVIAFSRKVVKRGIFRGGLVTSLTGLGKTYIIGGIILEVCFPILSIFSRGVFTPILRRLQEISVEGCASSAHQPSPVP
jgi:hypothetical protein